MYTIKFQALMVYLNLPNGIFYSKGQSNGDKASPYFKGFLIGNICLPGLCYSFRLDTALLLALLVSIKLNENVIPRLPPK
jgi:hypothetical protein